jgi:hypothetical protein
MPPLPSINDRDEKGLGLRGIPCQINVNCITLICPMVVGMDTPQCAPEGICICGPKIDINNNGPAREYP